MPKVRVRKLWLQVKFKAPAGISEERIIKTMIRSIHRGDYKLPRGWRAVIFWRNANYETWRSGEWRSELEASAESSDGFDKAVIRYLENRL